MTEYPMNRYLNVRKAHSPSFGSGGDRLSFLFDATGNLQVWELDEPRAWPRQRTFGDDRITFASWSPTRPEFAFGRDAGGDGNTQLFARRENGRTERLTDAPRSSHRWGGWNPDGNRFAFAANRRTAGSFDVYVRRRDTDEADLVAETGGWFDVLGWSPEGERLLLRETHASLDHDIHVLDIKSGETSLVTPFDGEARYTSVNWGPEGKAAYLVTDFDADTQYLARVPIEEPTIETVENGGDWNVDGLALHPTGRIAYGRNVDGYTELTVGELDGDSIREFPRPNLPDGVIGEVTFAPSADRFAATVTTRAQAPTVYVVNVGTGEAERWTAPSNAGIPREEFVSPDLVRFESFDGLEIPAFFSVPEGETPGKTPVIVDLHGGPESQRRPSFDYIRPYLVNRGFAVLEPNVRGSTGYGKEYAKLDDGRNRLDAARDVKAGVEWLVERDIADPERIIAFGQSYGGYLALTCLARYPDCWSAGVSISGFTDLVTFLENTGDWRREIREAEYGTLADDRAFLEEISPLTQADDIAAPLLMVHGANDPRIPVAEVENFVETVRVGGTTAEKLVFEDEGHGINHRKNRIRTYRKLVSFLNEHVGA